MDSWYNPYIVVPLATWAVAQLIKFFIRAFKGKLEFKLFYSSGGMPSAHSAGVMALATTAFVMEGITSPVTGLAFTFAAVVMYDSFGVRRASGNQSIVINQILRAMELEDPHDELRITRLREVFGHRPSEVVVGALLGVAIALLMTISHWKNEVDAFVHAPSSAERWLYFGAFTALLLLALVTQLWLRTRAYRKLASLKKLRSFVSWSAGLVAAGGLALTLMQFQDIPTAEWRLWPLLLLGIFASLYLYLLFSWFRFIPARYHQERERLASSRAEKRRRQRRRR